MDDDLSSDLSLEGTQAFFLGRDPLLGKAIESMETVESWTQDKVAEVQATLQALADRIESIDSDDLKGDLRNKLIVLVGYISAGKAIKLLMWIEQNHPTFVARTLAEAQMLAVLDKVNSGAAKLFVERFEVLERMHMLSRIFSEQRLLIVQKVLQILANKDGDDEESNEEDHEYA